MFALRIPVLGILLSLPLLILYLFNSDYKLIDYLINVPMYTHVSIGVLVPLIFSTSFGFEPEVYSLSMLLGAESLVTYTLVYRIFSFSKSYGLLFFEKLALFLNVFLKRINYNTLWVLALLISFLSLKLGIGRMGEVNVVLPFGLTGILNLSRTLLLPFLFVVIFSFKDRNKGRLMMSFLMILSWSLFDAFVRNSRSAFIEYVIPLAIFVMYDRKITFNKVLRYFLLLVGSNVFIYLIVTSRRAGETFYFSETFTLLSLLATRIFNRVFSFTYYVDKYKELFISDSIYDLSRLPQILQLGGSHNYTTVIVDGLGAISGTHSSGTTGLFDAFLSLGHLGFLGVSALAGWMAAFYNRKGVLFVEKAFGFFILRWIIWSRSISTPLVISEFLVYILLFILTKRR